MAKVGVARVWETTRNAEWGGCQFLPGGTSAQSRGWSMGGEEERSRYRWLGRRVRCLGRWRRGRERSDKAEEEEQKKASTVDVAIEGEVVGKRAARKPSLGRTGVSSRCWRSGKSSRYERLTRCCTKNCEISRSGKFYHDVRGQVCSETAVVRLSSILHELMAAWKRRRSSIVVKSGEVSPF